MESKKHSLSEVAKEGLGLINALLSIPEMPDPWSTVLKVTFFTHWAIQVFDQLGVFLVTRKQNAKVPDGGDATIYEDRLHSFLFLVGLIRIALSGIEVGLTTLQCMQRSPPSWPYDCTEAQITQAIDATNMAAALMTLDIINLKAAKKVCFLLPLLALLFALCLRW